MKERKNQPTIREVRLWELTREEFKNRVESGEFKAAILPIGSTEQHLEHLPMITDTASATFIAEQAALKLYPQVVVATPVYVGISEHWMEYKGTLTIKPETFCNYVSDIVESLKRGGISKVLILSGHAGNYWPLKEKIDGFASQLDIDLRLVCYWDVIDKNILEKTIESGRIPAHAQEFETSIAKAAFGHLVQEEKIIDPEAKLATVAKGRKLMDSSVSGVVRLIQKMLGKEN